MYDTSVPFLSQKNACCDKVTGKSLTHVVSPRVLYQKQMQFDFYYYKCILHMVALLLAIIELFSSISWYIIEPNIHSWLSHSNLWSAWCTHFIISYMWPILTIHVWGVVDAHNAVWVDVVIHCTLYIEYNICRKIKGCLWNTTVCPRWQQSWKRYF